MEKYTLEQIYNRAKEIQSYLEITVSEDPAEIQDRGNTLSVYMAETGKLLADAKYWQDKATNEHILKRMDTGLSPSILDKLVKTDCENENYLVNWMDRINRTCTHQMDWARSLISKAKEEMRFQNFGT